MSESPVLIVGAGPTGMVLALWLTTAGVPVRIIDKHSTVGQASRAMVVQARILEFYRQLGLVDKVIANGIKIEGLQIRQDQQLIVNANFGELGTGISAYPFVLSYPQDEHEQFLEAELNELGVQVEWNTELISFEERDDLISATLHAPEGEQTVETGYLCGCDGASSTVRHQLGFSFEGGTYEQRFFVADTEVEQADLPPYLLASLAGQDFCLAFPLRHAGMMRFIGIIPDQYAAQENLSFADLQAYVEQVTNIKIKSTHWFSGYHVHHRLAERFQKGRVFLAGDAGHIHSPAGGQGMNTGIGDAVNLAWKLADVVHGKAVSRLLESYEIERRHFAKILLKSTDQAFSALVEKGPVNWALRRVFFPYMLPKALQSSRIKHIIFRTISQTRIDYHASPLSWSQVGSLESGDRLPWVELLDNYAPLTERAWQIHIYGEAKAYLDAKAQGLGLKLYTFAWTDSLLEFGLVKDAMYVIRPDGHLGLVHQHQNLAALDAYFTHIGYQIPHITI
jgi:2-polyprenyl-6-methoxyphenol hydroxylase-like FAD-dependent oxidoreductase